MAKKSSGKRIFVIAGIIALALVAAGSTSYLIYSHVHSQSRFRQGGGNFSRGGFSLDNATIAQIENFFDSNPDNQSVQSYCQQNPMYCGYYCVKINPSNDLCSEIQMPGFNRTGMSAGRPQENMTGAPAPYQGGRQ